MTTPKKPALPEASAPQAPALLHEQLAYLSTWKRAVYLGAAPLGAFVAAAFAGRLPRLLAAGKLAGAAVCAFLAAAVVLATLLALRNAITGTAHIPRPSRLDTALFLTSLLVVAMISGWSPPVLALLAVLAGLGLWDLNRVRASFDAGDDPAALPAQGAPDPLDPPA